MALHVDTRPSSPSTRVVLVVGRSAGRSVAGVPRSRGGREPTIARDAGALPGWRRVFSANGTRSVVKKKNESERKKENRKKSEYSTIIQTRFEVIAGWRRLSVDRRGKLCPGAVPLSAVRLSIKINEYRVVRSARTFDENANVYAGARARVINDWRRRRQRLRRRRLRQ